MSFRRFPWPWCRLVAGATFLAAAGSTVATLARDASAAVSLAVLPVETVVEPGDTFDVQLTVPVSGAAFNGYDAIVGYDPTLLTFVTRTPLDLQQGPLMTSACANRFHLFSIASDSTMLTVNHVLLCAGVSVTGPGVVYILRFTAKSQFGLTTLRLLPGTAFYGDGIRLDDLVTTDATVRIGHATAGPPPPSAPTRLSAHPNPFNPLTTLSFEVSRPGTVTVSIHALDGRRIAVLRRDRLQEGPYTISWDGRDAYGRPVASGTYLARLQTQRAVEALHITLIR